MASVAPAYRFFTTRLQDDAVIAQPIDVNLQGTTLAEMVKLELSHMVESSNRPTAIVDFQNVKLISSSVISSFLGVKRLASSHGVRFKLCGMSESLRYVFRTLNMDGTVFEICQDVSSALADEARSTSYYDVCGRLSPPAEDAP